MKAHRKHKVNKSQVSLIIVMLVATVMTVVLAISFNSIVDTQSTKLEQESQKALSVAESAISVALKNKQTAILGPEGSPELADISDFSGSAALTSVTSKTFTSPTIAKDTAYTFYLGNYDTATQTIGASVAENLDVCMKTGATNPALEITLIKTSGVKKYVLDPNTGTSGRIPNASVGSAVSCGTSITVPAADIGTDSQFLVVRVFFTNTALTFSRTISNLPVQGTTVSSQVTSTTSGVSKKVTLFQSYPQIPAEFFATNF